MEHNTVNLILAGEFKVGINPAPDGTSGLVSIFERAGIKLVSQVGDFLQRVADFSQVNGFGRAITPALDNEIPASFCQLIEKFQGMPRRNFTER